MCYSYAECFNGWWAWDYCCDRVPLHSYWYLSHARDQWFPMYKLRIYEIWTKISRQNHFGIRTLIFLSMQSLSESVHYHQRDIFRKKLTTCDPWSSAIEPWYKNIRCNIMWYADFLCCVSIIVESLWRHAYCWTGRRDGLWPGKPLDLQSWGFPGPKTITRVFLSRNTPLMWFYYCAPLSFCVANFHFLFHHWYWFKSEKAIIPLKLE
jgi:hypothetical protein